jgi:hypothetical protein
MVIPSAANNQGFFDRTRKSKEEILSNSLGKSKEKGQRIRNRLNDVSLSSNNSSPNKHGKSPILPEKQVSRIAPSQ